MIAVTAWLAPAIVALAGVYDGHLRAREQTVKQSSDPARRDRGGLPRT